MAFFDKLSTLWFKTDSQGRELYFPDGFFGKGYILPDPMTKEKALKFHKRYSVIGFVAGLFVGMVLVSYDPLSYIKIPVVIGFLGLFIAIFTWGKRKITANLEISEERLTFKENLADFVSGVHVFWLWLLVIVSLLFIGLSILLFLNEPEKPWILLYGLIPFGPCAILFLYAIYIKKKNM